MANRTQIVCLHEGQKNSIDAVFINSLFKRLKPQWIRQWSSNVVRLSPKGGRLNLIKEMPSELKACMAMGGQTTLMVWADLDHDMSNGDQLVVKFWETAQTEGISRAQFDGVVFIFAKDRLENWIDYLNNGATDENVEGQRVKHNRYAADAAKKLAERCRTNQPSPALPPSLEWSCKNWRGLIERMT